MTEVKKQQFTWVLRDGQQFLYVIISREKYNIAWLGSLVCADKTTNAEAIMYKLKELFIHKKDSPPSPVIRVEIMSTDGSEITKKVIDFASDDTSDFMTRIETPLFEHFQIKNIE